ncbi:MAG: hypothetical protein ACOYD6_02050 [Limnochordia bacterium]
MESAKTSTATPMNREEISDFLVEQGAVLVGFAPVDRFAEAPVGHRPEDFLKTARSVIVWAVPVPKGNFHYEHYLKDSQEFPHEHRLAILHNHVYGRLAYSTLNIMLDQMAVGLLWKLEAAGQRAVGFPATYAEYFGAASDTARSGYRAPFSHRHAAVAAGLGEFGLNNLVLTPGYGPRVRFNSIITDLELEPTPLLDRPLCLRESCRRCLEGCVAIEVITKDFDGIFYQTPSRTDPIRCTQDPRCQTRGSCLRACPLTGQGSGRVLDVPFGPEG